MTQSFDDKIRNDVIQKLQEEKQLEENIRIDLVELQDWWELECKVIEEKKKILKTMYDELRHRRKSRQLELWNLHGANNVEKVRRKYNIRI
jgi:hypothetical protein